MTRFEDSTRAGNTEKTKVTHFSPQVHGEFVLSVDFISKRSNTFIDEFSNLFLELEKDEFNDE